MLLSAAIITRDEAEHLPGCLESISEIVDEIVVVDTGSRDATVAIARGGGARVACLLWRDDFAAARNATLDLARGRWILYIDADERLTAGAELRDELATTNAVAGLVRFQPGRHSTRYREYRLFRNRPDIRFRGAIHETMVPDIQRLVATEGAVVVDMPAEIRHLGYEGDQGPKHRRNLPLLRRAVQNDPDRIYLWFHLGAVHEGLGDADAAAAAWIRGVEVARRQSKPSPLAVLVYAKLAFYRLHSGHAADDLVAELRDYFPHDPLTAWVSAHNAMARGQWNEAVPILEGLARIDATALIHPVLSYDERIFGEFAAHCLGLCWFHLGDNARAEHWFTMAAEAEPDVEEYRLKRQLAAVRAARARA
ncbi:MAG: glycosyltransferase family 2 protein [Actinobacteria bacterium]|nr:MAG: glycosyltransferase family 2 protein [Actinomycetota bacterium]